jgi:NADPH:quinone reductase-like Zn-dependent oxidoreductase
MVVQYRGLSKTALAISFALCSRMVCYIYGKERLSAWTRAALEAVGWVFVAADVVYLVGWVVVEGGGGGVGVAAYSLVALRGWCSGVPQRLRQGLPVLGMGGGEAIAVEIQPLP